MSKEDILIGKVTRLEAKLTQLTHLVKDMASMLDNKPQKPMSLAQKPEQWVSRREWMEKNNKSGDQWRYLIENNKNNSKAVKETRPNSGRYLVNILANI